MTKDEAKDAIYNGNLVKCTKEDYENGLRTDIQNIAGKWIEQGQHIKAMIALNEVKRLDALHGI
jgi:hypothetical protein